MEERKLPNEEFKKFAGKYAGCKAGGFLYNVLTQQ